MKKPKYIIKWTSTKLGKERINYLLDMDKNWWTEKKTESKQYFKESAAVRDADFINRMFPSYKLTVETV